MTALTQAQSELVEAGLHVAAREAARLAGRLQQPWEDLKQEGYFGLRRAAQRFDPARHDNFPLFALIYVRGAMIDAYRRGVHTRLPERRYYIELHNIPPLLAKTPSISPEQRIDLHRATKALSPRQKQVINWRYWQGWTNHEIASHLGFQEKAVETILRTARRKLRTELKEGKR